MNLQTLPGLFISHGSPMLALDPKKVRPALQRLSLNLPKPKAIIVMSAHWESAALEVSTAARPETWHDFRGFPEALYRIRYAAAGKPELAEQLLAMFADAGFEAHANSTRPRDHGVWMPLLHMYPQADIPVVEISVPKYFSAKMFYQLGKVLAVLRQQQILIIGSGRLTYNLSELTWQIARHEPTEAAVWATEFRKFIVYKLRHQDFEAVLDYKNLPFLQQNHLDLEHLSPLFFAMGTGHRFSLVHHSFSMESLGMDIYRFD